MINISHFAEFDVEGPDAAELLEYICVATVGGDTPVGKGIYTYEFDSATGTLRPLGLQAETSNPTFLAFHPSGKFLYCVAEGGETGQVKSFAINPETTALTEISGSGTSLPLRMCDGLMSGT